MNNSEREASIRELQRRVDDWIRQWEEGYWPPLSNLARLAEEVGELARVLNHEFGAKVEKTGEETGDVTEEIGDVLFVLVTLANSLDVDLAEAVESVIEKYELRDGDRWTER